MKEITRFKLCKNCKSMIPLKGPAYCKECSKEYLRTKKMLNSDRAKQAQKVYNKQRYREAKQECMKRAKGLCEVCMHYGIRKAAVDTHHIVTVYEGNEFTHYDPDNLIAVCEEHHRRIEGMSREQLIKTLESNMKL